MSNFDIKLVGPDDVDEGISEIEKIEAAKELYKWPFERVRGIKNLVNLLKKYLLTTYGSDPSNPDYGSYFKNMIGKSYDSLREIADEIQTEVKRVEDQIKTMQTNSKFPIPDEGRLKEVRLIKVFEDDSSSLWRVNARYRIINYEDEEYENTLL
jgi:phage baseplate assembly protein W